MSNTEDQDFGLCASKFSFAEQFPMEYSNARLQWEIYKNKYAMPY